nr:hypothetical protein [Burkholderia ubonensis]
MPPDDLDQVEFGAAGRQVKQVRLVVDQPPFACGRVDTVMNAGVVQHNHGRSAIAFDEQAVDESDHILAFDGAGMCRVDQFVRSYTVHERRPSTTVNHDFIWMPKQKTIQNRAVAVELG